MENQQSVEPAGPTKATLIRYPRFNALHADIQMCQELSTTSGEPQCMALEGRPGAGKTTLVTTYAAAFPRYETAEGTKVPVFYVETPSPVTVKGMAARMLEVLGDPAAHKGPLWAMNARLIYYLKEACEVQLVILDDFHHLIDRKTRLILETVSDWLKVLIKETQLPFLVVGIDDEVRAILKTNAQLARLFAACEKLPPFQWEPQTEAGVKEFAAFIKYAEQGLDRPLSDEISRYELLHRLHYATEGVIGHVMNLLRQADFLAKEQQLDTLTLSILSQVFNKRFGEQFPTKINPFEVATNQSFVPPVVSPPPAPPNSTNRRSTRRRPRTPPVTQILKTGPEGA